MKKIALMILSILVLTAFIAQGVHAADYKWRLGTIIPQNSLDGQGLKAFADKVKEKTSGRMVIKIGFNSAYGKYADQMKAITMGSLEMMMEDVGSWELMDKNLKICRFPYVFTGWDHYAAWVDSPLFEASKEKLAGKNHHFLLPSKKAIWKRGPYRVLVSKKPVYKAEDLEELKLRLYESVTAKKIWRHMGAKITVIPWGEVYLALKQGMVEAATISISQFYDMKWHEPAPYVTNINEFLQCNAISVNKKKWDALPDDIKKAIEDSLVEVAEKSNEQLLVRVEKDIQKAMDQDGAAFIRVSLKSFSDKIAPLAVEFEKDGMWDKGLFEKVKALEPAAD